MDLDSLSEADRRLLETEAGVHVSKALRPFLEKGRVLSPADHLDLDLGFDSLRRLELLSALEQWYGHLPESLIRNVMTVRDLIEQVSGQSPGGAAMEAGGKSWRDLLKADPPPDIRERLLRPPAPPFRLMLSLSRRLARLLFRVAFRLRVTGIEQFPVTLLQMWPQVKAQRPDAELHLCRYSSMYDAGNWGKVCEAADDLVAEAQREVGGIVYLGELGKPDLYRAIAESAVMWYPGVVDFAETGCIAAVEAQACGTPFIGSYKGALPETAPHSVLVKGDASSPAYQAESVAAVLDALDGCRHQTRAYRECQEAGRRHVTPAYTYDAIAAEWEAYVLGRMDTRSANRRAVLQTQLLGDDHTAARLVASALGDSDIVAFCDRVIDGKDQTAEDYAERAIANPLQEMKLERHAGRRGIGRGVVYPR